MEKIGITQLYHSHASNIINMHEDAGTPEKICRATIERQLLTKLDKAGLPSLLKIAWNAAILKGRHFNAFCVKSMDRHHLSAQQIKHFRPDKALYDHHLPDAEPSAPATPPAAEPSQQPPSSVAANTTPTPRPRRNPPRRARPGAQPVGILKIGTQPGRHRGPGGVNFAAKARVRRF